MSHRLWIAGFVVAGFIGLPVVAQAQIPRECLSNGHNPEILCHKRGCERFCDVRHDDHKGPHHDNGKHLGHNPPPAAHHPAPAPHPAPVPAPGHHGHAVPVPPPAPHGHPHVSARNDQIEHQIRGLVDENRRLEGELSAAMSETRYCVYMSGPNRSRCINANNRIHELEDRIGRNNAEIERLKRMQH